MLAPATCRSCGANIVWTITVRGKRMPLDPEPNDSKGTFAIEVDEPPDGSDAVLHAVFVRPEARADRDLYTPHWYTCPTADQHR